MPKIARNGFQQKNSYSGGSIFLYKCNAGYRLVGPNTAYCTPVGWSVGQAPVCASKSGILHAVSIFHSSSSEVGCDEKELISESFEYGFSRSMFGGAVYRLGMNILSNAFSIFNF